ncbi:MAG: ATP-binding cassette domain-containing protein [Clostridiales Family XIII bacterium]|jgi:peptide/nickel transport system ATP-binding protein|nr:ATP-binding cassette domain-containing protein [Clostridiales Family XIII bacterium]
MSAVIEVKNLKKHFDVPGGVLHAVDGVSFKVEQGTTIGIVGESGCGKSTLGRTIIHLEESTDGEMFFRGEDVTRLKRRDLKKFRERVQMIFQDPYASLNPRMTIEEIVQEPLWLSGRYPKAQLDEAVAKLMDRTGVEERLRRSYPHELDGGRRQRVGIARALALDPDFIVCDEPVSALDVSIQAQILNLLMDIQASDGLTLMFITHDLSVVRHISDAIGVMYLGQMVEMGSAEALFNRPLHPYTKALLSAVPSIDIHNPGRRVVLKGELTSPINPGPGCRFRSRCPHADRRCKENQQLAEVGEGYFVACDRLSEINDQDNAVRNHRGKERGTKI